MNLLYKSILSIVIVLFLDAIWLTSNKSMYNGMIKIIQSENMSINIYGAIMAYILMFLSFYLIIYPNIDSNINNGNNNNVFHIALKHGAFFGFIVYGIYNFTNLAILKKYQLNVSIIDTLWGTFVYFIAVFLTIIISKRT